MSRSSTWWRQYPGLLATELELARMYTGGAIARAGDRIVFQEELVSDGIAFGLRIWFAEDHPYSPPLPFLAYPALPADVRIHRYVDGRLCLHSDAEWVPTNTVSVWARNRAVAWVATLGFFLRTGEWPETTELSF